MLKKILSVGSLVVGMIGVQPSQAQNFNQERLIREIAGDYASVLALST